MRIRFVVLSVLTGCLALLLGLTSGPAQVPVAPPRRDPGRRFELITPPTPPAGGAVERAPRTQTSGGPASDSGSPSRGGDERGSRAKTAPGPAAEPESPYDWVDERFLWLDRDLDGYLRFDELSPGLRAEADRWDYNRDARIDLDEWRDYVVAVIAQQRRTESLGWARAQESGRNPPMQIPFQPQPNQPPPIQLNPNQIPFQPGSPGRDPRAPGMNPGMIQAAKRPPFDESRVPRPLGQRDNKPAPNLPSNVPAWYKDYDLNRDGQVVLHEWKDKGDSVREFKKYDLNGDAYVTVDELVRTGQFFAGTTRTQMPPSVAGIRAENGEFFYFEVTGANRGTVWGTDVYTADSPIGTAAVHAGVLQIGETGVVKVTILAGEPSYQGTVRNGVRTNDYGPFGRSYRVEMIPNK